MGLRTNGVKAVVLASACIAAAALAADSRRIA